MAIKGNRKMDIQGKRSIAFRVYENKQDGRRICFPMAGLTAAKRSDIRFRRKVVNSSNKVRWKVFGTLTYSEEHLPHDGQHMRVFFKRMREYNRKVAKVEKVEYIWREDFGKLKRRPHYHFLTDSYVNLKLARGWWGRGFVWLVKVRGKEEVKKYLYKYMCKDRPGRENWKKHRYGSSRGVPAIPKSEWKFVKISWEENIMDDVFVHNQREGILDAHIGLKIFNGYSYVKVD